MKTICKLLLAALILVGLYLWAIRLMAPESTKPIFTDAEEKIIAYASANGLSADDYPDSLVTLLEQNPETEDFVLSYPFRKEEAIDLSEYTNCETVPLFLQWDKRWGYSRYGSDFLAVTGCGPTCLAMVGYHLTGDDWFTPINVARFAEENSYYVPEQGSSWTLISEGAGKLGLEAIEIPMVKSRIIDNLEVGNPIILAMGPGDFTTEGHYIILTGVESGSFRVNDPNSRIRSEQLWTYETLEEQVRNLWVIRLP